MMAASSSPRKEPSFRLLTKTNIKTCRRPTSAQKCGLPDRIEIMHDSWIALRNSSTLGTRPLFRTRMSAEILRHLSVSRTSSSVAVVARKLGRHDHLSLASSVFLIEAEVSSKSTFSSYRRCVPWHSQLDQPNAGLAAGCISTNRSMDGYIEEAGGTN